MNSVLFRKPWSVPYLLEHVFATIAQMGGKMIRTIGQARANFAMTMTAACYNLKRLVYFNKAGITAF